MFQVGDRVTSTRNDEGWTGTVVETGGPEPFSIRVRWDHLHYQGTGWNREGVWRKPEMLAKIPQNTPPNFEPHHPDLPYR